MYVVLGTNDIPLFSWSVFTAQDTNFSVTCCGSIKLSANGTEINWIHALASSRKGNVCNFRILTFNSHLTSRTALKPVVILRSEYTISVFHPDNVRLTQLWI